MVGRSKAQIFSFPQCIKCIPCPSHHASFWRLAIWSKFHSSYTTQIMVHIVYYSPVHPHTYYAFKAIVKFQFSCTRIFLPILQAHKLGYMGFVFQFLPVFSCLLISCGRNWEKVVSTNFFHLKTTPWKICDVSDEPIYLTKLFSLCAHL